LAYTGSVLGLDDGFGSSEQAQGQYFNIYYKPQADVGLLLTNLNVSSFDKLLVGRTTQNQSGFSKELGNVLDTLFLRVCDILDMRLYSFHGKVKICRDHDQLNRIYRSLFDRDLNTQAFYAQELNTIYISEDNFKRQILGHEVAHAIMSNYFVVSPSVKVQEILAMYVEYQLRQTGE
jgi:hypothetical protein